MRNVQHRSKLDAKKAPTKKGKAGGRRARGRRELVESTIAAAPPVGEDGELVGSPGGAGGDVDGLLLCPGVVYLLKPRSSGSIGVTTTKKGGLSEALLWQMHDVLLSKSMLAHHDLGAYIHALDQI